MAMSAEELRTLANGESDPWVVRKLLALALVAEGSTRSRATEVVGVSYDTFRIASARFSSEGIDGLRDRPRSGRPPDLDEAQWAEVRAWVLAWEPDDDSPVRELRADDVAVWASERFGVPVQGENARRKMRAMGLVKLKCRPVHYKADPAKRQAFKDEFPNFVAAVAAANPGKAIEVWAQDETRIGQKGALGRRWAEKGSQPTAVVHGGFQAGWLFGAFCAERDVGVAEWSERVSTEVMNRHLASISSSVPGDRHAIVVMDGAGWHAKAKDLVVPPNLTLATTPPYCPELNPAERVWGHLKGGPLLHRLYKDKAEIVAACAAAWAWLVSQPGLIKSLCSYPWLIA